MMKEIQQIPASFGLTEQGVFTRGKLMLRYCVFPGHPVRIAVFILHVQVLGVKVTAVKIVIHRNTRLTLPESVAGEASL
ncbi:hypothetical protein ACU60U_25445 [Klebsiella aerogenes]